MSNTGPGISENFYQYFEGNGFSREQINHYHRILKTPDGSEVHSLLQEIIKSEGKIARQRILQFKRLLLNYERKLQEDEAIAESDKKWRAEVNLKKRAGLPPLEKIDEILPVEASSQAAQAAAVSTSENAVHSPIIDDSPTFIVQASLSRPTPQRTPNPELPAPIRPQPRAIK